MCELVGKRVKLIKMDDPFPLKPNEMGTVKKVDDIGQIHVNWDCGSSLSLIPEKDIFEIM
jgi:hypothetical protein